MLFPALSAVRNTIPLFNGRAHSTPKCDTRRATRWQGGERGGSERWCRGSRLVGAGRSREADAEELHARDAGGALPERDAAGRGLGSGQDRRAAGPQAGHDLPRSGPQRPTGGGRARGELQLGERAGARGAARGVVPAAPADVGAADAERGLPAAGLEPGAGARSRSRRGCSGKGRWRSAPNGSTSWCARTGGRGAGCTGT